MSRPLIGITTAHWSSALETYNENLEGSVKSYIAAVRRGGGLPLLIPLSLDADDLRELFPRLQGVLVPGGGDVDPRNFSAPAHPATHGIDADRDRVELSLLRRAVDEGKPLLGICRGVQALNVALGGTLWQDLPSEYPGALAHYGPQGAPNDHLMHSVRVEEESALARILGQPIVEVNSWHHQALKEVASGLAVVARAPDGVIEAVEIPSHPFALGVQWHPEHFLYRPEMRALFEKFVEAAGTADPSPRRA